VTNELIFYTQIISIISFVFALFGLYRILVKGKEAVIESKAATIELLKERNEYLKHKLSDMSANTTDNLTISLSSRVQLLEEELERLSNDRVKNQDIINLKEKELIKVKSNANKLSNQIAIAHELIEEFSCPYCTAPMVEHAYDSESVEDHQGREFDVEHELISYECGHIIVDGYEQRPCSNREQNELQN
jgi:hypothetical protein